MADDAQQQFPVVVTRKGRRPARSETVTVRFDPRLRYLAELAARKQRRTLSSFTEWAVEEALARVELSNDKTVASEAKVLWQVHPADRFCVLAIKWPDLLDSEQQAIWHLVRERPIFWLDASRSHEDAGIIEWSMKPDNLRFNEVRFRWDTLLAIVRGEASEHEIPDPNLPPPARPQLPAATEVIE